MRFEVCERLSEQSHNFFILNCLERLVERTYGLEVFGDHETNQVVAQLSNRVEPIRRGNGHGHDQLARALCPNRLQGREHGRAGGNSIVRDNHRTAGHAGR